MLEANKVYDFKKEFCVELDIPMNQPNRRKEDLLNWLKNFFDYELLDGNPIRIFIKAIYGEYQQMPRKVLDNTLEKKKDYEEFTIAALGTSFKPNSKSRIAKEAIDSFGYEKYYHTNNRAVAANYIKEPFDKYGETNGVHYWVYYKTYEPLEEEVLADWKRILEEEHISEQEAASAFYRHAEGEDISKEVSYYKTAQKRFKDKYGDIPIKVKEWKLKIEVGE